MLSGKPTAAAPVPVPATVTATDSSNPPKVLTFNFTVRVLGAQPAFAVAAVPAELTKPVIISRTVEGVSTIAGRALPSKGETPTTVQVFDEEGTALEFQGGGTTVQTDASGLFSAALVDPLFAGEKIHLAQFQGADPVGVISKPYTVRGVSDWGRVRAHFAGGMLLARDADFKNESNVFMAFSLDKNWIWAGQTREQHGFWHERFMWNTFFETRLTSVPESQQPTDAALETQPAAGEAPSQLSSFISSRKAALMQVGNYFPIITTRWKWQRAPNALFIAPLVKIGFITPTGQTNATVDGQAVRPVNPEQFYTYYGFGGRVGHFKMAHTKDSAPELISYLDVIIGRYSNLETLAPVLDAAGHQVMENGQPATYPRRQYRVGVEGLLKIPSTPLVLGFSANVGQNLFLQKRVKSAKDDLRFFFGTRFDVGRLLGQLQQFR